jgi:hypothetical protein
MLLDRAPGRWLPAIVEHAGDRCGCLKHCLAVVLLVGLGGLPVFARASPPDSVGLTGIYDNADYDDLVALLTDIEGLGTFPLVTVQPLRLLGLFSFPAASTPLDAAFPGLHLRSPPTT